MLSQWANLMITGGESKRVLLFGVNNEEGHAGTTKPPGVAVGAR
jgi:hypothetical protein